MLSRVVLICNILYLPCHVGALLKPEMKVMIFISVYLGSFHWAYFMAWVTITTFLSRCPTLLLEHLNTDVNEWRHIKLSLDLYIAQWHRIKYIIPINSFAPDIRVKCLTAKYKFEHMLPVKNISVYHSKWVSLRMRISMYTSVDVRGCVNLFLGCSDLAWWPIWYLI